MFGVWVQNEFKKTYKKHIKNVYIKYILSIKKV